MPPGPTNIEDAHIEVLASLFAHDDPRVLVGIGDDAAVMQGEPRNTASSVDVAVEGVHFERGWLAMDTLARRAFMAAASDLAAMGAEPSHALCAWTLPANLSTADVRALGEGTRRASIETGLPVVGGNLARAPMLSLTTTVVGLLEEDGVLRRGGRPGQFLHVTGPLGGPRVGLELLRRGEATEGDPFVHAFRAPRARLDLRAQLRARATCAMDLSDGLLPDLARLCRASDVGARLRLDALPRLPGFDARAAALELDPAACLLAGGEEYELLLAADAETLPWATCIGSLCGPDQGLQVLDEHGQPVPLPKGFEHF